MSGSRDYVFVWRDLLLLGHLGARVVRRETGVRAGAVQCGARGTRKMTSEQFYRCCSNFHLVVFADY